MLRGFFTDAVIEHAAAESAALESSAFYSNAVHNVYLAANNPEVTDDHPFNRPVVSNKGPIDDDLIARNSPLREIYGDQSFRSFLGFILGLEILYPYPDKLSTIVISVAREGMELGWHFDTSASSLVLFRGRNALHRVTPVAGSTTRSLAIFAFNARADASMSGEALMTFFGRTS